MIDLLATLEAPGPTATALSAPFWEGVREGRFRLPRCRSCGRWVFYPRAICPHCWSDELAWRDASGHGRLKTFSVVHRPGHPAWAAVAPYVVGLVELVEGPTMLSLILIPPEAAVVGLPLRVRMIKVGRTMLPLFEPAPDAARGVWGNDNPERTDG